MQLNAKYSALWVQRACLRRCCRPRARALASMPDHLRTPKALEKPRPNYRDISENVVYKSHNAFNRKVRLPVGAVQTVARLYQDRKGLVNALDSKRHARGTIGKHIRAVADDPVKKQAALDEAKVLKAEISVLEERLARLEEELETLALALPNDTHPDVPIGPESVAITRSTHGPEPIPADPARDHVSICRALDIIDLKAAATVTGSSWYYLKNEGALLEIALVNYALSVAMKHGYTPVITPDVVRADIARRCGFQPRDPVDGASQMYHITHSANPAEAGDHHPDLVLAGTAEIPLAGMFANKILYPGELPKKVVGLGHSFRAEAGARGTEARGLYRVHQFTKLELFVICTAGKSDEMMEEMRNMQTEIFEGLGLSFRVLEMPTEELGASAYRKYDAEAWMPGRGGWGEISSTSNCTDYQARRLHIRHHHAPASPTASPSDQAQPSLPFAHTLNGTAAAVPRLIVALVENGAVFDEAGAVTGLRLPKALQPFWIGGNPRGLITWV